MWCGVKWCSLAAAGVRIWKTGRDKWTGDGGQHLEEGGWRSGWPAGRRLSKVHGPLFVASSSGRFARIQMMKVVDGVAGKRNALVNMFS